MSSSLAKIIVVADDLTGANDTGVQFANSGFKTISLLDVSDTGYAADADVWVINAETRSMDDRAAYQTIAKIAERLPRNARIFKKIDSTMRGHVGAELNALLDTGEFDVAAVIPAYPSNRRTTVGGYHFVNKILLEETEISRDPKCPVAESHLPTLLASQSGKAVGYVGLRMIRKELQRLLPEVQAQISSGKRMIVFDSESQQDLQAITQTLLQSDLRILWVGSAGLGQCLATELASRGKADVPAMKTQKRPTFVIAGSVSAITQEQVRLLREQPIFQVVTANPRLLLDEQQREGHLKALTKEIVRIIDQGKSPVLVTDASASSRVAVEAWIKEKGINQVDSGNMIADSLGKVAAEVLGQRQLLGFVLTGGDIAYRACLHLEVKALQIVGEVEEGIPLSTVIGGNADKLPVVTKAGAFGDEQSLVRAVEKILAYTGGEK